MEICRLLPIGRVSVDATGLEYLLRENRPLRLSRARGQRIRCTAGHAWITAPGMAADIVLRRGEDWRIDSDGLVLVEALGSAAVAIYPGDNA